MVRDVSIETGYCNQALVVWHTILCAECIPLRSQGVLICSLMRHRPETLIEVSSLRRKVRNMLIVHVCHRGPRNPFIYSPDEVLVVAYANKSSRKRQIRRFIDTKTYR